MENHNRGIFTRVISPKELLLRSISYDICTRTRNIWKSVRPQAQYLGHGTGFLYLPGTSVSTVRRSYPRTFCEFCTPRGTIPAAGVQPLLYLPGTSVSSVRPMPQCPGYGYSTFVPARNFCEFCTTVPLYTRNFWKFCKAFIPVSELFC